MNSILRFDLRQSLIDYLRLSYKITSEDKQDSIAKVYNPNDAQDFIIMTVDNNVVSLFDQNNQPITNFIFSDQTKLNHNQMNCVDDYLREKFSLSENTPSCIIVYNFLNILASICSRKHFENNPCLDYLDRLPLIFVNFDASDNGKIVAMGIAKNKIVVTLYDVIKDKDKYVYADNNSLITFQVNADDDIVLFADKLINSLHDYKKSQFLMIKEDMPEACAHLKIQT